MPSEHATVSRRDLLSLIGAVSGSAAMYHAMTSLGFASDSGYKGPIKLDGNPKGASVVILGAGLAGMTAALELRKAGYQVRILEFNGRAGGRNWTLRGGDSFTELGGFKQTSAFATSRPISRDRFQNCSPRQRSRAGSTKPYRKRIAKS